LHPFKVRRDVATKFEAAHIQVLGGLNQFIARVMDSLQGDGYPLWRQPKQRANFTPHDDFPCRMISSRRSLVMFTTKSWLLMAVFGWFLLLA
jgi:hypothetical protein